MDSRPEPQPRFVVQCMKGKGWKTLVVDDSQPAAERAFREVVKVKPSGFFRLIRLDDKPDSEFEGQEFSWKLLQLHDPRGGAARGGGKRAGKTPARAGRGRHGAADKVPVPVRLYGAAIALGIVAAAALLALYGPALSMR